MVLDDSGSLAIQECLAAKPSKIRQKVLIVEDDFDQREVLLLRFRKLGFRTFTATNGWDAIEEARRRIPDIILLDIEMPGRDGLSVCQELGDDPQTCMIPVIVVSGSEREGILRLCRKAGCRYFIRKPYDPNALLTLAEAALGASDGW